MIKLRKNKITKKVSTGYSWKLLFFGIFYTIYRNDWNGLLQQCVLLLLTGGLCWLVVPFIYNKRYIRRLMMEGYEPADIYSEKWLFKHLSYE